MGKAVRRVLVLLLLSTAAHADERFGVLEFFVRGSGAYCQAAAPSVLALQDAMEGRAVVLEYPVDSFPQGRLDRFWAAYTGPSPYLPIAVVGSGYDVCQGPVDYATRYRQMLEAEIVRSPRAAIQAWSRPWGDGLQVFATARNLGAETLRTGTRPTFWLVVWEDGRIGLTKTFVRATASRALAADVPPGGTTSVTLEVPSIGTANRQRVRAVVLLDELLAGSSRYDLLQSVVAQPAGVSVTPAAVTLGPAAGETQVTLEGPHVLTWSATSDVAWLEVTLASGPVPGGATIRLVGSPTAGATGTVRFSASGEGMDFTTTVTVTAAGPDMTWEAVVPAVSHAPGAFGSLWRTDLAAVNDGATTASVTQTFVPVQGASVTRTAEIPPGGTREWADVLTSLFGVDAAASASGVVRVASDRALHVASRTFSEAVDGTFGGYLPAVTASEGLVAGTTGILPQLTRTALFRTNVGVTNLSDTEASVTIRLRGKDSESLGVPVVLPVPPRGLVQVVDVFGAAGAGDRDLAWATIDVTTSGAFVWAYASVIDNRTGDPTIVPLELEGGGGASARSAPAFERTIPAAAHAPGVHESLWRTDVALVNASGAEVGVDVRFVPAGGGEPVTKTVRVAPGTRAWSDVLVSLFGLDAGSPISGALHFRSDGPLVVSSRTFNVTEQGSFGAHLAGIDRSLALTPERPGVLPQLKRTPSTRTNVGLANPGASPVGVAILLRAADGAAIGTEKLVTVPPGGLVQENDVFASCGAGDAALAWARIEVRTVGGEAFAYASIIDNRTGDPTIVPATGPRD
jgi:hypothetical protein